MFKETNSLLLWHDPDRNSCLDIFDDHQVSTYYSEDMSVFQLEDKRHRHKSVDGHLCWIKQLMVEDGYEYDKGTGMTNSNHKEIFKIVCNKMEMYVGNEEQTIKVFHRINTYNDVKNLSKIYI